MECPLTEIERAELIIGHIARSLAPYAEAELKQHILCCTGCRESAAAQEAVWRALEDWRAVPVSPEFDRQVFERIAEEPSRWGRRGPDWRRRSVIPVGATCIVLLAAFLLQHAFETRPGRAGASPTVSSQSNNSSR